MADCGRYFRINLAVDEPLPDVAAAAVLTRCGESAGVM
jgi:hypothetical protein